MKARPLHVDPLTAPPDATVVVPGSKSITNRALVCAALATGTSKLSGLLIAEDTLAMVDCLRSLGASIEVDADNKTATVTGTGGALEASDTLWVRQSGTTARFVLPLAAIAGAGATVDGDDQIRNRPQADLVDALETMGARIESLDQPGQLPLRISGGTLQNAPVVVPGDVSSQFVSALLLAGPALPGGVTIELVGAVVSMPYIAMTVAVMRSFGADIRETDGRLFEVAPVAYEATAYDVEPDASTASYFFAAGAISPGGRVTVPGLDQHSLQGDTAFVDVLADMGASVTHDERGITVQGPASLIGVDVDMADFSDTAPTLGAIAALATTPTTATGIGFIRAKESDRIAAVVDGLAGLGVAASNDADGFTVQPGPVSAGLVDSHDDHRNAMAFSVLGLVAPGIAVTDPQCVAKTFPEFFDALDLLRSVGDRALAILAIDGPAGSGKSTVAKLAAQRLGLQYLDTGAMYRSVTHAAIHRGIDPGDRVAVAALARHIEIDVGLDLVLVDGDDVTTAIRTDAVNASVSVVAANPAVRAAMRRQQRAWARRRGGGVMEGRDIGSVVFPGARLKVYVTASIEERARRRAGESDQSVEDTMAALAERDRLDSGRADSPLTEASDAVVLDTTGLTIDEVVGQVSDLFSRTDDPETNGG